MFFSKNKPLVALDIGSYSVKLAQLKKTGKGYELINFGMIPIPPDTMIDGEIENPEAITGVLRNLFKAEKLKNKDVIFGISGQSVIIKKISVPLMSEDELAEMIREEAEQYIPFDIDEVHLDFQIISAEGEIPTQKREKKPDGDEEEQMDVLIVAARKDTIRVVLDVAKEVGLKVRVVDLAVFALENSFEQNNEIDMETSLALVNIGASSTNVNIIENGVTAFTRDLTVGGNTLSEELQKNLSIGFADAEKLKLGILFEGFTKADAIPHVKAGLDKICGELRGTFEIFEKTSDYKISKVHLSGGTCLMEGIDKLVQERLGIETELMNTFRNIRYSSKNFDEEYIESVAAMAAIPVGLALRMEKDK
ncbi:MAG: pilus assembly protein PilM [bacterium]|nr:MAG: pilus assembly protein PilM [bacterium]